RHSAAGTRDFELQKRRPARWWVRRAVLGGSWPRTPDLVGDFRSSDTVARTLVSAASRLVSMPGAVSTPEINSLEAADTSVRATGAQPSKHLIVLKKSISTPSAE